MNPGRELDALVAAHVLSVTVFKNKKGGWSIEAPDYYDDHGSMELMNPLPQYSSDIAAAWEIAENLIDAGWEFNMFMNGQEYDLGLYKDRDTKVSVKGESAPHAICLAALKAVGYKY